MRVSQYPLDIQVLHHLGQSPQARFFWTLITTSTIRIASGANLNAREWTQALRRLKRQGLVSKSLIEGSARQLGCKRITVYSINERGQSLLKGLEL